MDKIRPTEADQAVEQTNANKEAAEIKLRSLERAASGAGGDSGNNGGGDSGNNKVTDSHFADKEGRPITLRTWESGDHAYTRAYDMNVKHVPDNVDTGQAGYANASLELIDGQPVRVRLNDIGTYSDYQGAGIANKMLEQTEQYARKHGAAEIYGSIDSQEAQNFWKHQAEKGWAIREGGYYGQVYRTLT